MKPHSQRTTAVLTSFAAGALLVLAGPAKAQSEGPSLLQLLPITDTIEIGGEITATLTLSDYVTSGRRVRAYGFSGARGAPVTIDLISDEFDAYVLLIGPDGTEVATDDDSGGGCHARISTFLPAAGEYRIVTASFGGDTGGFTLRVDTRQHPAAEGDCGGGDGNEADMLTVLGAIEVQGSIGPGEEMSGTLQAGDATMSTDGSYIEAYHVVGTPGQRVVIDVMSRAFDTLMFVIAPDGSGFEQDDDSGGACNSRLAITLEMQPHTVLVNSIYSEGTGAFTIRVSETVGQPSMGDCPVPGRAGTG
jgi:serine protease Do